MAARVRPLLTRIPPALLDMVIPSSVDNLQMSNDERDKLKCNTEESSQDAKHEEQYLAVEWQLPLAVNIFLFMFYRIVFMILECIFTCS